MVSENPDRVSESVGGNEPPKRRFEMTLTLHADTMRDVASSLRQLADGVDRYDTRQSVWGGFADGGHYAITEYPDVDHDSYVAALDAHLAQKDGGRE